MNGIGIEDNASPLPAPALLGRRQGAAGGDQSIATGAERVDSRGIGAARQGDREPQST